MTSGEAADAIVEYLRRDDRTRDIVWGSAWAFEAAIQKAIEEIQARSAAEDSCCAFCER